MLEDLSTAGKIGVGLVGLGLVIGLLSTIADTSLFGVSGGTLVFFGVLVLVISALRGDGQQQQQQMVVVQGGQGSAAAGEQGAREAVRCPDCERLNPMRAAYCGQCGTHIVKKAG